MKENSLITISFIIVYTPLPMYIDRQGFHGWADDNQINADPTERQESIISTVQQSNSASVAKIDTSLSCDCFSFFLLGKALHPLFQFWAEVAD